MYRVFIHPQLLKKKTKKSHAVSPVANEAKQQLVGLPPGTELNVHTAGQTYYNALFQSFNEQTEEVSLLIDPFYKDGGQIICVKSSDILSLDFPVSENKSHFADKEDE
ncbi:hypothetical protein GFC29_3660 [Anoxybacillus sp. B7M1]|jgi:hypothetical protein|uniref:Uncharacterized protein n=1 Tax=Anoxybacteroides rupiense TaxID=311460 RepID=A0ABD5IUA3_9BACL|nr:MULTISPECIES: hypothetical protein [Anoxybacillus]ANB57561.1 hypothetical protein GFC28_1774 [Anoxybacillus sp. B2M1]ANB62776.1 hypothetical protein GFC29_3660 [Anoxybacillus sp. B7M1]KXG10201.1 hypothetical protein AT864_01762 [Anoxybacillus sp. P3H1B]MBB3907452.1 hypothetical protein [Anoxybacillus rupiensis]MBS2770455.1 hypothetical protein [Anoxybacillus rupiensis]